MNRASVTIILHGGTAGLVTLVSAASAHLVERRRWYLSTNGYVVTARGEYMHRILTGAGPREHVDHKNLDRLDNRDENLRRGSQAENNRNVAKRSHSRQAFKGVRETPSGSFAVRIRKDKREIYIGTFETAVAAAKAYDAAAIEHHGAHARLNFGG